MSQHPDQRQMHFLITGGARGIGRCLARGLLQRGHRVFLIDHDAAELTHTAELLHSSSATVSSSLSSPPDVPSLATCEADVSSLPALRRAVAQADAFFAGRLDCLVNNAMHMPHVLPSGGDELGPRAAMDTRDRSADEEEALVAHWDAQIAVGLSAPFHLSRLCVGMLSAAEPKGCVVNVSSTRAAMAEVDHEGYSAAKAGLLGLAQSMSVSLGTRYGVRVNSLVLGWVNVANESREADEKKMNWEDGITDQDHRWHPVGRVGQGEDVLRAVEYLATSEWVTGTEMVLDGGVTRRMVYPE